MTHSPAPWRVFETPTIDLEYIKGNLTVIYDNESEEVASYISNPADAALIAAAPEMYRALVLAYLQSEWSWATDDICKAISKAEGRENAFVDWFKMRAFALKYPCGSVNINTNTGMANFLYDEIMERAATWESITSKAEPK